MYIYIYVDYVDCFIAIIMGAERDFPTVFTERSPFQALAFSETQDCKNFVPPANSTNQAVDSSATGVKRVRSRWPRKTSTAPEEVSFSAVLTKVAELCKPICCGGPCGTLWSHLIQSIS